jgi:L-aminopeptidase/D-esterase-like protein
MSTPRRAGEPGPVNGLTDVAGLRVGHHTAIGDGYLTGTTVVLAPPGGMVAGIDVRGGGPATHETDLLAPTASVERIHALVLTGGSAYGLATCTSVMDALADRGVGLMVGPDPEELVPLVPGAAVFDLGRGGDFRARPTAEFGTAALADALRHPPGDPRGAADGAAMGSIGAGTGAVASNLKGGIGGASLVLAGDVTVAAMAVVNAAGSPIDPRTGDLWGARQLLPADGPTPRTPGPAARAALLEVTGRRRSGIRFSTADGDPASTSEPTPSPIISNTTLVVVATDVALTGPQCTRLAAVAQNGLARALNPVHTMFDGDLVFGLSTATAAPPDLVGFHDITVAGADVVTRAITRALLAARTTITPAGHWPSWTERAATG